MSLRRKSMMRWPMERLSRDAAWANVSERGSDLSLRFIVWSIRKLGQAPMKFLLPPIALYYCAFASIARRGSRAYLEQLDRFMNAPPRRIGLRDFYGHIYRFADVLLDRFALWAGDYDRFEIRLHGREHMQSLVDERRGAFLIGAHLGSFDILRVIAREANIPVNVLMYTGNAEKVNAAFEALDPECNVRVIDIDPTSTRAAFEIRSCVSRGEFVAILGDRAPLGSRRARVSRVNFLGRRAAFPQGPFLISAALRLPVILTVALKTAPNCYDVFLETLSTGEPVAARDRERVIRDQIQLYASRLEEFCQRAPLQWFNFYDFWAGGNAGDDAEGQSEPQSTGDRDEAG
jgi:predicted LPLAT superfamily acyltransferase